MHQVFVTVPKGVETLLLEEVGNLGIEGARETRAGVYFSGALRDAYRVCLWSRLASRVLLLVGEVPAGSADELYEGVLRLDWPEQMDPELTFAVMAVTKNSQFTHSGYVALRVKDAIVDCLSERAGRRPNVDPADPDLLINVFVEGNVAKVYVDLSGDSLHRRGYRTGVVKAPLKENLAAALLLRAAWPRHVREGHAFVDFMCGSGTLVVEAALMACDVAPGLDRATFGFEGWRGHDPVAWDALRKEAIYRRRAGLSRRLPAIMGFDKRRDVVAMAERHVQAAGLADVVRIQRQDLESFRIDVPKQGLVLINPPYGRRLGSADELGPLYERIGRLLRTKFEGWDAAVLTNNIELGKKLGVRATRIHSVYNGTIPCKLLHFRLTTEHWVRADGLPRLLPVEELSDNARMLANRLVKNDRRLRRWRRQEAITCYRLYDADLPNYAAVVDVYEGDKRWVVVQEYKAPKEIPEAKARRRLRELLTVVADTLETDEDQLFLKRRSRQRGNEQYGKLTAAGDFHEIMEGPNRYLVNFENYLDTGLYLDKRESRMLIGKLAAGRRFLNLYGYTGTATVSAAAGGASSSVTVDLSKTYLEWARRNLALNKLAGKAHEFINADCRAWLDACRPAEFDLVLLDPPTFSNSKKLAGTFDVQRDHRELIELAVKVLRPNGILLFVTNAQNFRLDQRLAERYRVSDITEATTPPDFRGRKPTQRSWQITRSDGRAST